MLVNLKNPPANTNEAMDGAFLETAFTQNQVDASKLLEATFLIDVKVKNRNFMDDCLFNPLKL